MATEPGFLQSLSHIVRRNLAMGRGLDHRLLRELASDRGREKSVRRAAAMNPTAPPDMLVAFMRHAWQVRVGLARNPALSFELQERLANDSRKEVRRAIANREDAIPDVLRRLGERDPDPRGSDERVGEPQHPSRDRQYLAACGNVVVISAARKRLERPDIYFADQRLMRLRERLEFRLKPSELETIVHKLIDAGDQTPIMVTGLRVSGSHRL